MCIATHKQGFTLLELIIVMVLFSLMASFAVPKIRSSFSSNELNATAQRFVSLVTEAAQEARARHTVFSLRFNRDSKTFLVIPVTSGPKASEEAVGKAYLRAKLEDSVSLDGIETRQDESDETSAGFDDTGILFTHKGYTQKAAVYFEDDNGDQLTVILSPFLGIARILDGHVSLENDRIIVSR
ncbi:MAG: type II secretion system protein GspH [Candidatus Electrothrix sp. MAN1_4]|nr:type II secretion system protein GspH [Candidatus Electrothrix sp. MAN1_4]